MTANALTPEQPLIAEHRFPPSYSDLKSQATGQSDPAGYAFLGPTLRRSM